MPYTQKNEKIQTGNQSTGSYNLEDTLPVRAKFFNDLLDDVRELFRNLLTVTNDNGDIKANLLLNSQITPAAKTVAVTLTAAEILTEIITGTHAAAATQAYTLPTGTQMETALGAGRMAIDQSFNFSLINLSAAGTDTITLTAGASFTIVGNPIILNLTSSRWKVRKTALNTFVAYRLA